MRTNGWAGVPWQSKPHKVLFWACAVCLSLYLAYVTFLAHSPVFLGTWETLVSLAWFLALGLMLFCGLVLACRRLESHGRLVTKKSKASPLFFLGSMGLSLCILGCSFLASYPGAVSYDVYNQWIQARTGLYNSWHPVFHTLLMGLGIRMGASYPLLVLGQVLCFSAALAYLMETLRAWGLPKALLLVVQGLVAASGLVGNSMMYLWKDNAMTLGTVVLCAQGVNVYLSKGAWLEKRRNAICIGLALAFTTLVRHNAMFFTLPLLACLLLCYRGQMKKLLWTAGVMALCVGLVMGPLYGSLDLIQAQNTLEESVGIPMTVLFDARLKNPEALDEEAKAFLRELVSDEVFTAQYRQGNYNSIKFEFPREYIAKTPPEKLLRMTLSTLGQDPRTAFGAVNTLTDLVWDVTGNNEGIETIRNSGDLPEVPFQNTRMNQLGKSLQALIQIPMEWAPLRWTFQNIGVQFAALLICGLWALYRSGPRALALCGPILCYNLGTMLLLCGNDARFFQFSMVISIPSILALSLRPETQAIPAEKD